MFSKEFRKNNFYASCLWLEKFSQKENKKRQFAELKTTTIDLSEMQAQPKLQRHVVFTLQNIGKNPVDTQKMQAIHAELEDLPLSPSFAIC